jgi:hypothetical protein
MGEEHIACVMEMGAKIVSRGGAQFFGGMNVYEVLGAAIRSLVWQNFRRAAKSVAIARWGDAALMAKMDTCRVLVGCAGETQCARLSPRNLPLAPYGWLAKRCAEFRQSCC